MNDGHRGTRGTPDQWHRPALQEDHGRKAPRVKEKHTNTDMKNTQNAGWTRPEKKLFTA